jgi:anti-sigma B factor antagonist
MVDSARRSRSRADRRSQEAGPPEGKERRLDDVPHVKMEIENTPEGLVLHLANPLVVNNCFEARDRIEAIRSKYSTPRLFINLTDVPYADSAGLGMLLEARGRWLKDGRDIVLRHPTHAVLRGLKLLQLDMKLEIEED